MLTVSIAPVAQWIEHQPPELGVGGSTPLRRAKKVLLNKICGDQR